MYSKEITEKFLERYKEFESIKDTDYKRFNYYQNKNIELFELFRHLRNNLAHNTLDGEYPFIVSDKLLESIESLIDEMKEKLIERSIPIDKLVYATLNANVLKVVDIMNKNKIQFIPILENDMIKYVFSSDVLLAYISSHHGISEDLKMRDIAKFLDKEKFRIIELNTFTYEVEDLFRDKKINVVFITRHGRDDERILGMVTSYEV